MLAPSLLKQLGPKNTELDHDMRSSSRAVGESWDSGNNHEKLCFDLLATRSFELKFRSRVGWRQCCSAPLPKLVVTCCCGLFAKSPFPSLEQQQWHIAHSGFTMTPGCQQIYTHDLSEHTKPSHVGLNQMRPALVCLDELQSL